LHEELRYFKSKGVTLVQQGTGQAATGQSHYAFLDLGPQGAGLALEISYNPDVLPAGAKSENEYPLNQLTHFAMVARDLNKMGSFYERLGFGGVEPIGPITLTQPTYRDQPGKYDFKLGWWHWQRTSIELIEPTAGPSIYDEHLKEHGEGLQHIGFTVSDMDAALERMKDKGVAVAQGGGWDAPAGIGRFAYFDTEEHGGVTLEPELTFWPSGSQKYTSVSVRPSTIFSPRGSSAPNRLSRSPRNPLSPLMEPDFPDTTSFGVFPGIAISSWPQPVALPCADRESRHPLQHRSEQPPGQMTLRQQQPIIAGMFHQPAARLHQPLLETRQRPVPDSLRQS